MRTTRADIEEVAGRYIERLTSSSAEEADRAYRDVLEAPSGLMPALIPQVENRTPTSFYTLEVLALHDDVARLDEDEGRFYYFVKGMGRFAFDDVAAAPVVWRGRKATRVRFRSFEEEGFPVGVVLRAALLERLKSPHYPAFDDKDDLVRWWRAYYRLWKASRSR